MAPINLSAEVVAQIEKAQAYPVPTDAILELLGISREHLRRDLDERKRTLSDNRKRLRRWEDVSGLGADLIQEASISPADGAALPETIDSIAASVEVGISYMDSLDFWGVKSFELKRPMFDANAAIVAELADIQRRAAIYEAALSK